MTKLIKDRKVRPDGRVSINISFTTAEYHLINHVDKNSDNFSQYMKDLIQADIDRKIPALTLERINKLIESGEITVKLEQTDK